MTYFKKVAIMMSDDTAMKNEVIHMSQEEAEAILRHMPQRITRITETATPDENGVGAFVLSVEYESILVGARLTIIS